MTTARAATRPEPGTLELGSLEDHRRLGQLGAGLGRVRGVVEADPEDRARARHGARRVTSESGWAAPVAAARSPEARRSSTVPDSNATTSSPRTSPATGSVLPWGRNVASFIDWIRRITDLAASWPDANRDHDTSAITAAAQASSATYRSFADATRAMLDLLERHMPEATLFLAHLDRGQFIHRVVDTRKGGESACAPDLATPLGDAFCWHMAEDRGPRLCDEIARASDLPVVRCSTGWTPRPTSASRWSSPTARASAGSPPSAASTTRRAGRRQLFVMLARVLASELERESDERDLKRFNDMLRDQARGMAAVGRVARALASGDDARAALCEAACEVAGAPVAFLLEPSGRDFASTAMTGANMRRMTIQRGRRRGQRPGVHLQGDLLRRRRPHAPGARRAARGGDRRALGRLRAVLRDGQVSGVLIVIWRVPLEALPDAPGGVLRLLAAQAAVAIEYATLRDRLAGLRFTDPLTGLATRRMWDEEVPRELARTRRSEVPLTVAVLDVDHMSAFDMLRGEKEGDRLIKECGSRWRNGCARWTTWRGSRGRSSGSCCRAAGSVRRVEVLDRVRESTPRGQTASAGVARWDGEEPGELLLARAGRARGRQVGRERHHRRR